jgi:hypothetical protein
MRRHIRRLLVKYRYPPDKQEAAIVLVMNQAERLAEQVAAWALSGRAAPSSAAEARRKLLGCRADTFEVTERLSASVSPAPSHTPETPTSSRELLNLPGLGGYGLVFGRREAAEVGANLQTSRRRRRWTLPRISLYPAATSFRQAHGCYLLDDPCRSGASI